MRPVALRPIVRVERAHRREVVICKVGEGIIPSNFAGVEVVADKVGAVEDSGGEDGGIGELGRIGGDYRRRRDDDSQSGGCDDWGGKCRAGQAN